MKTKLLLAVTLILALGFSTVNANPLTKETSKITMGHDFQKKGDDQKPGKHHHKHHHGHHHHHGMMKH